MPTTSSKSMSQIKWYGGTGLVWDWNTNQSGGYAGHNLTNGYYTTILQFTTPSFTGLAASVSFSLYAKRVAGANPVIRAAIATGEGNASKYLNTSEAVSNANQVAAATVTFSNVSTSYGNLNFTIDLGGAKLKGGTTYYLFLWAGSTGSSLIMLSTATTHTFAVNYNKVTTPVLSAATADMGAAITISTESAPIASAKHDLKYKLSNGTTGTIASKVGATKTTWKVVDCAAMIPNGLSTTIFIICTTYDAGGSNLGSVTVSLVAKVPAGVVPVISAVTVTETVSGLADKYKGFVQSKSRVKVSITAAGAGGSTVKSISSTLEGKSYSGASWTAGAVLAGSGTLQVRTTVTDSRGRTASRTTSFSVLAYSPPKITTFSARRVASADADAADSSDGNYVAVKYAYSVPSLNGGNTASMTIMAKQATAASYGTTLATGSALSADATARPSSALSSNYRWDIQIKVTDAFGTAATATVQIPSAAVVMDVAADGLGLGIGKTAEGAGLDVAWPITARKGVTGNLTGNASTATTATKLGTANVGSASQPIYLAAGVPKAVTFTGWKVLWTNSSPTASFAAKTLTVSGLSGYDLFCIFVRHAGTEFTDISGVMAYVPGTGDTGTRVYIPNEYGYQVAFAYRNVTINRSKNTVKFSAGFLMTANGTEILEGNQRAIPVYILGTKI